MFFKIKYVLIIITCHVNEQYSCAFLNIFSLLGYLHLDCTGVALRASVYELRYLHHAGVPQGEVRGPEDQDLPILLGYSPFDLHKNICKCG